MSIDIVYKGKCDNCEKPRPKILVQVYGERGDGVLTPMLWCLGCVQRQA